MDLLRKSSIFFSSLKSNRKDGPTEASVMNNDFIILVVISPSLNFTDDTRKPSLSEKLLSALGVT